MTPFFRRIRKKLANDNQFLKYSRYAIGEVVLVVIGILIALYINNWNEQQKEREKFDQVLAEVETELIGNIKSCRNVLNNYLFRQDSFASLILFDELTYDDYRKSIYLRTLTNGSRTPSITTESYDKLLEINGLLSTTQDSIRRRLKEIYQIKGEIYRGGQRTSELARRHRTDYKEFSWYNDWLSRIPNEDRINYLVNNPRYKKDVGEFINEQMSWLRPDIETFEIYGRKIYKSIFEYLELNLIKHEDSLYFQYTVEDYIHYVGNYIETDRSSQALFILDSTIISKEDNKLYYTNYFNGTMSRREIIPVSKYNFRTEIGSGFYRLHFDDRGKVIGQVFSDGLSRRKFKKIQ